LIPNRSTVLGIAIVALLRLLPAALIPFGSPLNSASLMIELGDCKGD
jgi:hypothetical protein